MRTLIATAALLLALLVTAGSGLARPGYQTVRTHAGFTRLYQLTTETDGNLYAIDETRASIIELSPAGSVLQRFRLPACGGLSGVAVSPAGALFVSSGCAGQVFEFSAGGLVLRTFGRPKGFSSAAWRKNPASQVVPQGVALDTTGHIYVPYCGNPASAQGSSIEKFTLTGKLIAVYARNAIRCPFSIAVDSAGSMYVSSNGGFYKLSSAGKPLGQWGKLGSGLAYMMSPAQAALDGHGHIDILDYGDQTGDLAQFTTSGRFVRLLVHGGYSPDRVSRPIGIAIDGQGHIYVADNLANRISRFAPDGTLQAIWNP